MIVTDQAVLADWVLSRKSDADLHKWAAVGNADKDGNIKCVVVYNHPAYRNINAHILSDGSKRWADRKFIFVMFHYPFIQLGVNRITAPIAEGNDEAIRFVEKLGFSLEGRLEEYRNDGTAQLLYGMLRRNCKWI